MSRILLLLDEDTQLLLARTLRAGGHDAVHVTEAGMGKAEDPDVLAHAVSQRRVVYTHNTRHYLPLAKEYARLGKPHSGIFVSGQAPFAELRHRLLRFLREHTAGGMCNVALWLP